MSGCVSCKCGERDKPIQKRNWSITQYKCNHSAFNGYHRTYSEYSTVVCNNHNCSGTWRTKAAYVEKLKIAVRCW